MRLALSFGNERLGGGASGQHGLVGIFDEPVELAQREFPRLALPGKVRSAGMFAKKLQTAGIRQTALPTWLNEVDL